jgi:asparagine synthase (glutamine-hydrolysing)
LHLSRLKYAAFALLNLKQALYDAVCESVPEEKVGVAFSGGVDSSLLAKVCLDLGKKITLLTIGFPGSHDLAFSKHIASKMSAEQQTTEIDYDGFTEDLRNIRQIINCKNTSHIENCIAYLYISRLAKKSGLNLVLSANGCDELFCGYNGYRMVYNSGEAAIMKFMDEKIANEFALMGEISTVASQLEVQIRQPYLSTKFINFSKMIPLDQKIKGPDDMTRKHILRQVALSIGVPVESARQPKKALQYGSLIHKYLKKIDHS